MSFVGIDFGSESCFVTHMKSNDVIDIIKNSDNDRGTPSYVAFATNKRLIGNVAKDQLLSNVENTTKDFKRLLGKQFKDVKELEKLNYKVIKANNGGTVISVDYSYCNLFHTEQIVAMLFTKLKQDIEDDKANIVLTVPSYYTNFERQAILNASKIAGLKCLGLIDETTAIALNYQFNIRNELTDSKPKNIVFIDFGHTSLQIAIVCFTEEKMEILASSSAWIGGRTFDRTLAEYFCNEFKQKYQIDPNKDVKAYTRLTFEVENIKKAMSTNTTNMKLKIDHFMGQEEVESVICRSDMEKMCHKWFDQLSYAIKGCITRSKLEIANIQSVEITGGSSKIPAFKKMVQEIFQYSPKETQNKEAVSSGGSIYCSIMSKVLELENNIKIVDHCPIDIHLNYENTYINVAKLSNNSEFPFKRNLEIKLLTYTDLPSKILIFNAARGIETFILKWRGELPEGYTKVDMFELRLIVSVDTNGIVIVDKVHLFIEVKYAVYQSILSLESQRSCWENLCSCCFNRTPPSQEVVLETKRIIIDASTFQDDDVQLSPDEIRYFREKEIEMMKIDSK